MRCSKSNDTSHRVYPRKASEARTIARVIKPGYWPRPNLLEIWGSVQSVGKPEVRGSPRDNGHFHLTEYSIWADLDFGTVSPTLILGICEIHLDVKPPTP